MDIKNYTFETPSRRLNTDDTLLKEAKSRGFYNGNTKYNRLFSTLFFEGGAVNFKDSVDLEFKEKAVPYLKALMGSFQPSHEDKEAVSALILSELAEV